MEDASKAQAQDRADRIAAFHAELEALEREKVLVLPAKERAAVDTYHQALLARFAAAFDIDRSRREKQLSLGMKVTSFLGALALGASLFFLFYRFWGHMTTPLQVGILIAAPLLALVATAAVAQREKNAYFGKLFAMAAFVCFVLDLSMLGQIFNIPSSPNAFLVWAGFAFLIAYAVDARLMLATGIVFFTMFLSAKTGAWNGCYWIHFGERPENFFPAGILLFALAFLPHRRFSGFQSIYRVFALLIILIPVLILSHFGGISYLPLANDTIEPLYQLAGFGLSAAAIWLGIRKGFADTANTGNVFFALFLYTKFYDWWWAWMPKYLFFLLIALSAIGMLFLFRRLRAAAAQPPLKATP